MATANRAVLTSRRGPFSIAEVGAWKVRKRPLGFVAIAGEGLLMTDGLMGSTGLVMRSQAFGFVVTGANIA